MTEHGYLWRDLHWIFMQNQKLSSWSTGNYCRSILHVWLQSPCGNSGSMATQLLPKHWHKMQCHNSRSGFQDIWHIAPVMVEETIYFRVTVNWSDRHVLKMEIKLTLPKRQLPLLISCNGRCKRNNWVSQNNWEYIPASLRKRLYLTSFKKFSLSVTHSLAQAIMKFQAWLYTGLLNV